MLAALRVAAGGCAPFIAAAARHGREIARSGRESRLVGGTREQGLGGCGQDAVALGIEGDGADRGPVAGRAAPAPRIGLARLLVQGMAGGEDGAVSAGMALRRGDVADAAVMMVVVPEHEGSGPLPRFGEVGKAPARELRAVLGGAEQRFGVGIIVADPGPRMRGRDAEPVQHGGDGGCLHARAVVAVQHRAGGAGMDALGQRRAPDQMSRVLGLIGVVHLKADDLAAEEVEDDVEVEPAPLHPGVQERHIPTPNLPRGGGHMRAGWACAPGRASPAAVLQLAMLAQHAMEAGLAGDIDALVGQRRDDPRWRRIGKAWLVGQLYDARSLGLAERVRRPGPDSLGPTVGLHLAIRGAPALEAAQIDAGQAASRGQPGPGGASLADLGYEGHAVFPAGHSSSPSRKTAPSFFASTSKAAVSANALSLRCSSRSSSFTRRRSCRASAALAARGSPRPAMASCFQASSSAGKSPCSRHQALRAASSIAAVVITASSRAAGVQRWGLVSAPGAASAPARHRASVATLTPISRETTSMAALSGGNSRATMRSLYACPYRATA